MCKTLPIGTFTLVARDPNTGDLGIVVASKFLAVGSVVPWARAKVGAIATQPCANPSLGPIGLALMEAGAGPEDILAVFVRNDPELAKPQFGCVLASGESPSYTGQECHPWAGSRWGPEYAAQGNLLTGPGVLETLERIFLQRVDLPFPERLLEALLQADRAGGGRRGRQSAALLVVGEGKGYGGMEPWIDLRVNDHPEPILELQRRLGVHRLLFGRGGPGRPLQPDEIAWIQTLLHRRGLCASRASGLWDEATEKAFATLKNLQGRYRGGSALEEATLRYLQEKFA